MAAQGCNAEAVADYCIAALAWLKQQGRLVLPAAISSADSGDQITEREPPPQTANGAGPGCSHGQLKRLQHNPASPGPTVGIIGAGHTAQPCTAVCIGLWLPILVCDPPLQQRLQPKPTVATGSPSRPCSGVSATTVEQPKPTVATGSPSRSCSGVSATTVEQPKLTAVTGSPSRPCSVTSATTTERSKRVAAAGDLTQYREQNQISTPSQRTSTNKPPPNYSYASLGQVLQCDIVSLHVPLTTSGPHATADLLGEDALALLKEGATLLNTSRGEVINEAALLATLQQNPTLNCVLDVWSNEPVPTPQLVTRATLAHPASGRLQCRRQTECRPPATSRPASHPLSPTRHRQPA